MGIHYTCSGDFSKTREFLNRLQHKDDYYKILQSYGEKGVMALREATPKDTGETADSWYYEIERGRNQATIHWCNSNVIQDVNIAIILQYGHATSNGGYYYGTDYINPALRDIFDELAKKCWEEVTRV